MRQRAITLLELMVSMALASIILVVLGLLYRAGSLNFEQGTSQVLLTQTARLVVDRVTPYVCSAIPAGVIQGQYIYSPETGCSEDPNVYPNIYCLDFISCIDFLNPKYGSADEDIPGYTNRRGTGPRTRYRIRFDLDKEELLLEKIAFASADPPAKPTLEAVAPRLLGRKLARVTFERSERGVNLRISARTTNKDGKLHDDLRSSDGHVLNPDSPDTPSHRKARSLEIFTTVLIPYQTSR